MILRRCCCYPSRLSQVQKLLVNQQHKALQGRKSNHSSRITTSNQLKRNFSTSLFLSSSESSSERNLDEFLQPHTSTLPNDITTDSSSAVESITEISSLPTESFAEYGLGGYEWPSYWLQNVLETLHCSYGLEWIPSIALLTVCLRTLALPAYIKMQQFSVRSANTMPEQMRLQYESVGEVNPIKKKRKAMEYMEFMRANDVNPIKNLLYMTPNAITFMSFYWALKGMASAKLPSLTVAGLGWFTDLTLADPYCILPVLSCTTLHLMIRFGGASSEVGANSPSPTMNKFILYSPFIMIPFFVYQPSALFMFWLTSNMYSAALMVIFKTPKVKKYFNIPERDTSIDLAEISKKYNIKTMMEKMNEQRKNEIAARDKVQNHMEMLKKHAKKKKEGEKES